MPGISVVIPVYNVEPYLAECLESVISQSFRDLEILCVNDGSTDRSAEILDRFANSDSRIKILTRENGGLSAARNDGMDAAAGTYLFFLDSDDLLAPGALERMVCVCKEKKLDELHVNRVSFYEPGCKKDPFEEQSFSRGVYKKVESGEELFVHMIRSGDFQPCVWTRFFRRRFLQEKTLRFHPGILHEDEVFSIIADLAAKRAWRIPDVCLQRRVRAGSIMTGDSAARHVTGYLEAFHDLENFLNIHILGRATANSVRRRMAGLLLSARKYAESLPDTERAKFPPGNLYFPGKKNPLDPIANAEDFLRQEELADERDSRSLLKKFLSPLTCLRENGFTATWRRIVYGKTPGNPEDGKP